MTASATLALLWRYVTAEGETYVDVGIRDEREDAGIDDSQLRHTVQTQSGIYDSAFVLWQHAACATWMPVRDHRRANVPIEISGRPRDFGHAGRTR